MKISEKLNQPNLLKMCLQDTYPADFCIICSHVYKGNNFCDFLFAFLCTKSLLKLGRIKGSIFFPLSVDFFSEGGKSKSDLFPLKVYYFPLNTSSCLRANTFWANSVDKKNNIFPRKCRF